MASLFEMTLMQYCGLEYLDLNLIHLNLNKVSLAEGLSDTNLNGNNSGINYINPLNNQNFLITLLQNQIEGQRSHVYQISKQLIELGIDIECKDKGGFEAIHYAACFGHLEVLKLLLEKKPRLVRKTCSVEDYDGKKIDITPLKLVTRFRVTVTEETNPTLNKTVALLKETERELSFKNSLLRCFGSYFEKLKERIFNKRNTEANPSYQRVHADSDRDLDSLSSQHTRGESPLIFRKLTGSPNGHSGSATSQVRATSPTPRIS